jgi:sulfatase modifying factor 1
MFCKAIVRGLLVVTLVCCTVVAQAVNIETVFVGDPGNVGELSGSDAGGYGPDRICGAVGYTYNIGKYEVTAGQYTEFLNAKATLYVDTYALYHANMSRTDYGSGITRSGSGIVGDLYTYSVDINFVNRPVNYVSFWDAARFTNWLGNGQSNGDTENGAYTLNGYNDGDGRAIQRNAGATWVVTSEDEWYKAAYYKGGSIDAGYWAFPTKSDTAPGQDMADASGNNANCSTDPHTYPIDSGKYTTVAGEFQNSASPYGTFDQGGNVWEWNEAVVSTSGGYSSRGIRGGSCACVSDYQLASDRSNCYLPGTEYFDMGFRVASVPGSDWIGGHSSDPTDWGLAANWDPSTGVPDGPGTKVGFGNQSSDHDVVDMIYVGRTVGSIAFAAATSTTIQSTGGYNLTLDNNGNDSIVTVEGSHFITAKVILDDDLDLSGSGTLTLSGGVSGPYSLNVLSGALSASSISVETLSIGAGTTVTIMPDLGGILYGTTFSVPEPGSLAMLVGIALTALLYWWRKRA